MIDMAASTIKAAVVAIAVAIAGFALISPAAMAASTDPLDAACNTVDSKDSPACKSRTDKNPLTGDEGMLLKIANIVAIVAGIVGVVIIIIGGLQMILANGDAQKAARARKAVLGAVIGIVIILVARSIIALVMSNL